jgi:hypothetical protein
VILSDIHRSQNPLDSDVRNSHPSMMSLLTKHIILISDAVLEISQFHLFSRDYYFINDFKLQYYFPPVIIIDFIKQYFK